MSKGFKKKQDSQQEVNSAAQLQAITQLVLQTSQHVRQLQQEISVLTSLLRMDVATAVTENSMVLIDAMAHYKNQDGSKGDLISETVLISHVVDMAVPTRYIPGFVEALKDLFSEDVKEVALTFPSDYEGALAGKKVVFTISVVQVFHKVPNDLAVLSQLPQ